MTASNFSRFCRKIHYTRRQTPAGATTAAKSTNVLSRIHQYRSANARKTVSSRHADWQRLRLLNYFRSALALFFITLYLNGWLQQLSTGERLHASLYIYTAFAWLLGSVFFIYLTSRRQPDPGAQVFLQTLIDIIAITLIMHAAGGVQSGVGMLLIISISMTSLFLRKRLTFLFAAIATLAVLTEQVVSRVLEQSTATGFTQAGMLGILIFASALLTTYIANHLRATEKLAEDKSQLLESAVQMNEQIIANMRTGILVVSDDATILMANNAAAELLGQTHIKRYSSLRQLSDPLHQRFRQWLHRHMQDHTPIEQANGLPDLQAGFSRIERETPHGGRNLIFLEDATQLGQRFQQVKLASLGRLTASIAHEIRNPLAAINHAAQLLAESHLDEADKKLTGIINTQTRRLNRIVENVLQLSRQQQGQGEAIELHAWLQAFRDEFHQSQGIAAYQLQLDIQPDDLRIQFDPTQLHQVMWNLCSNAIHHSGMTTDNIMIHIRGRIDAETGLPHIDLIDNGPGIDADTQAHIFEPFFTTRKEGTGLGLYLTREIIETNRAKIRYIDLPTGGTCFRIHFLAPDTTRPMDATKMNDKTNDTTKKMA